MSMNRLAVTTAVLAIVLAGGAVLASVHAATAPWTVWGVALGVAASAVAVAVAARRRGDRG